ncbi:hypothetical protein HHK36_017818 [Tetracentron sinense]|uniref:High chlorophyll fluorescence 153 n=1 Tax=Tetracentron sinense TaxID=13715 RepID=A0A834YYK2_TETSI|nr:hypothetical protein HHK36_017818 [Tetracentron sinense]
MASLIAFNSVSTALHLTNRASFRPSAFRFAGELGLRNTRGGLAVVTRAAPSTSNLVFAFVFPISLLAVTIFTSIKIADKLDKEFLEEVAVNQVIKEGNDEDDDTPISLEEEPALPRTRNRPKREA